MTHQQSKKQPEPEFSEHGLVRRVARKLGKSESLVSAVKRGKAVSQRVSAALEAERKVMRLEQDIQARKAS